MKTRKMRKIVHEGEYVAEVVVDLIDADSAARYGRVYRLTPV